MGSLGARRLAALLLTLGLWGCQGTPSQEQAARFDVCLALAQGYVDAGDFDRARRPLASALEINDRALASQPILARIYDGEGEPDLAEDAFRRARRYPGAEQAEVQNDYGVFLYRQARYEDAVVALRRAAEDADFPARAVAFEGLGLALEGAEAPEAARDAFQRALALTPCAQRPLLALTRWYLTEGDIPEPEASQNALRAAPDNEESLALALAIARRLGDPKAEAEASRRLEALGASAP